MEPYSGVRSVHALVLAGVILAVVVPVGLLFSVATAASPALVMQFTVVLHSGCALAVILSARDIRLLQFGFWLFVYIWLGLAPLAMIAVDEYPWALRVEESVAFRASLLVELGLIAYTIGSALGGAFPPAGRHQPLGRLLARPLSLPRVLALAVLALCVGALLIPKLGGITTFFTSRELANAAVEGVAGDTGRAGRALLNWGLSVPAFWALLGILFVRRKTQDATLLRIMWAALVVPVVALNIIVNNPLSQPRFWAGTVLLALLFASRPLKSVRPFQWASALVLVSALFLFPLSDYYRSERHETLERSLVEQFLHNPDYDAYQQIQGGVLLVDEAGHQPTMAAGPPLFWVPRAIWPDKPEDAGTVIGRSVGYRFLNLSSPFWIESYIWGGILIMTLLLAGIGALSRRVDQLYNRYRQEKGLILGVFVPALTFYQVIVLRGSLLAAFSALSLLLLVPFLISRRLREDATWLPQQARDTHLMMRV